MNRLISIKALLYPIAAASNLFSVTALLIFAGLLGKGELASDIAIVQAAIVAVFLSLSGNARNIILTSDSGSNEKSLLYFRLATMVPASIVVFYLTKVTIEVSDYLVLGLILRKCSEWGLELQLANQERKGNFAFAFNYIQVNAFSFLVVAMTLLVTSWNDYFPVTLCIWAVLPILFLPPYIRLIRSLKQFKPKFYPLVPHLGSSTVIGISMYVFRILIVILVGKTLAGQMFTAYAIGGLVSALYTFAIGPSLMLKKNAGDLRQLLLTVFLFILLGTAVVLSSRLVSVVQYSPEFVLGVGYSLIGGGVMLISQRQRLYILQICERDVFVPDALANILLIASIPFVFYLVGATSVIYFFLWSAILHLFFYGPLAYKNFLKHA